MRSDKQTVLDIYGNRVAGDQFDRKQTEKELTDIINNKNEQIAILHQVNSRLGYQLCQLQRKLGIDSLAVLKEMEKVGEVSVADHSDLPHLQYLEHLMLAYDETILKQKKIIALLYSQLEDAERKAESYIREKEYLLEQNKNKCKKILEIYHRGCPQDNLTASYNKLMRQSEGEKSLLVREQSEHILDAYKQLQNKSIDMEKELEEERANANKFYQSFKRQSQELKDALMSVDNLVKVKDFLEKTVNKLTQDNISLQNCKNQMEIRIGKLQSQLKSTRTQMFNQKKISREDSERASLQVDSMKSQLQGVTKRQRQNFNKMMNIEKDLQAAKDSNRSLKRQNQKIKSDFQQTLKMCQAYQTKMNNYARKDDNMRNIIDQNKQKIQNILLEKDKAILKVDQLQKILQNMNDRHRQELSKQRENYEKMLTQFQEKMRIISDQKQQCESIFMETELGYKNQIQKLKRQNNILHEQNIKFVENIRVSTGSQIINKLKEYQSKNDSLTKLLNQKQRALKQSENKHEEFAHEYESQVRNLNRLLQKEKTLTTQYMKQLTQERSKANILVNQRECLENQLKRLKKSVDNRNMQMNDEKQYRIVDLENRLNEAVKKEKEIKSEAIRMLQKYDQSQQKLKNQYHSRIDTLQTQNEKLRRKLAKLTR